MKNKFEFFGAKSKETKAASHEHLAASNDVDADELLGFCRRCWAEPQREFQQAALAILRKRERKLEAHHIGDLEDLIITKSWWDTVDGLAAWIVGPLVLRNPPLVAVMDQWIDEDNLWLARTAILHQLKYKESTDQDRLFTYALKRATNEERDREFFIRKAIGWALRQYAKTNPDAVRQFVDEHADRLSPLSKREATKHL